MTGLPTPLVMLGQFDWYTWLAMFWFMILLEFPRYTLSAIAVFALSFARKHKMTPQERTYLDSLKLSVVVAGHNEAGAMGKCLRSLKEQTRRIDEIIVIDDGSKDGTADVVRQGFAQDPRVTLITVPNGGKARAINIGLVRAKGDVVVVLDADTQFEPQTISRLLRWFVDPQVGAVAGNARSATASTR